MEKLTARRTRRFGYFYHRADTEFLMTQEWFCLINGEILGPFDARAIQVMAERGRLRPNTHVRRGGDGQWVPASNIKGLTFQSANAAASETSRTTPPVQMHTLTFQSATVASTEATAQEKEAVNFLRTDESAREAPPGSSVLAALATGETERLFEYKMVQVPPTIEVQEGTSTKGLAAAYLEDVVNKYAERGWEFHRVDEIGIRIMPGCLMALLGQEPSHRVYYVVTFRRSV